MEETKQINVHSDFASWYAAVELNGNNDRIVLRRTAIEALLNPPDREEIDSLVHIVYGKKLKNESIEKMRKYFRETDETFSSSGNEREMQILAASTLASLLQQDIVDAAYSALSIVTTSMNGCRTLVELPMDLLGMALNAIPRISERLRERVIDPTPFTGNLSKTALSKETLEELEQDVTAASVQKAINSIAHTILVNVQSITKECARRVTSLERHSALQDEETEMLWWTLGQRSIDWDCSLSKIPEGAKPLAFAKELADATKELPGPYSVKSLLTYAGLLDKDKIAISDSINAYRVDLLEKLSLDDNVSAVITPVHFGIQRKLETNDNVNWSANWRSVTGIESGITPIELGLQFYYERILLLLWE